MNEEKCRGVGAARLAIVGVGSPHGDDQVGWLAIDRLRPDLPTDVRAVKVSGGADILELLTDGHDEVVIIDAAAPAGCPGLFRSFQWTGRTPGGCAPSGTHGLGLVEALHLAEALGRLPRIVLIATVEAGSTAPGASLSESAKHGLHSLVDWLSRRPSLYVQAASSEAETEPT